MYDAILENMVYNKDEIGSYKAQHKIVNKDDESGLKKSSSNINYYEYVIITDASLKNSFNRFVNWKRKKGIDIGVVTPSEIAAAGFTTDLQSGIIDEAGGIREYLSRGYAYNGTVWALMGGDFSKTTVRYGCGTQDTWDYHWTDSHGNPQVTHDAYKIPTDLYFAEFNGDWDVDNDQYYGEEGGTIYGNPYGDSPQYLQEIGIGRLLCTTPEEVERWTEKVILYEQNPGRGDLSYLTNSFMMQSDEMQDGIPNHSPANQAQLVANHLPSTFSHQIWQENGPSGHGSDPNPTFPYGSDIINEMNSTNYSLWSWFGHGTPIGCNASSNETNQSPWSSVVPSSATGNNGGLDELTNYNYPAVVYSIGCDNTPFDDYDPHSWNWGNGYNLGEAFTIQSNAGGVAFLGNTRYGVVRTSYKMYQRFADQLCSGNLHLGSAESSSKGGSSDHLINFSHNLIGCPETRIWTDIPNAFNSVNISEYNSFILTVNANTSNCTITFMSLDNGQSYYNSKKNISVNTAYTPERPLYVTIDKAGYLPKTYMTGGTITNNTTIYGKVHVIDDVTVASSTTLTIDKGAELIFENNSSLIVTGESILNVNGTSNNKVTFDFVSKNSTTQNGIKLDFYAEANINHAIIKNAYNGIWAYRSDLTLNNSEVHHCTNGLYLRITEPGGNDAIITNNYIHNCSSKGIYSYYSNGDFSHNQILNDGYAGIYFYGFGNQNMAPDDNNSQSTGHNKITGSYLGVKVYHANPNLGRVNCIDYGGYNHIDCNTEMRLENNSHVYAQHNYWGSYPYFQVWSGSTLDHSYELSSPPATNMIQGDSPEEQAFDSQFTPQLSKANNSSELLEVSTSSIPPSYDKAWSLEWKLLYARNLMRIKNYNAVKEICKDVITEYPDSSFSYLALDLLHQSYIQTKSKEQFAQFIEENANQKVKKDIYGMAELLLAMDSKENRVSILNNLMKKYEGTPISELILFDKFVYYLNEGKNIKLAEATSDELGKLFPKSESYYDSRRQLVEDVKDDSEPKLAKESSEETITEIPKNYELKGNYPNPFNPSTTISYALPYSSNVELTIYDITGKVVKTFVEEVQSAGYQNAIWNGTNQNGSKVSSGVYFYRFKATSLEGNGKVFEKTAKMMLLK